MDPIINLDPNIQKYLQTLDEFTNDQLVVHGTRFQDEMGNFLYQKRDGEQVKIIPPVYTKNVDRQRLIEEENSLLNLKLQLARNNLSLMEESEQKFKDNYNDQVTRSEKVYFLLKQYKSAQKDLKELQTELQNLQLQNDLLLKTEYQNGKLAKSGSLVNLGKQIKELTSELDTKIKEVFPEGERPQIYELNKAKISETEKGVKLKLIYVDWKKLAEDYNTQLRSYKSNLKNIEWIEQKILALKNVNKFNLEEGNPVIQSSRGESLPLQQIQPLQQQPQLQQAQLPLLEEQDELDVRQEELAREELIADQVTIPPLEPQPIPEFPSVLTGNKNPKQIFAKPPEDKIMPKKKVRIVPRKK